MLVTSATSGRGDGAELGDLAEPAHAHLGHQHLRLRLEPQHRQRQPDLVVPAALGSDGRHDRGAERAEDVLRRGLSRRADDGDDASRRSASGRATRVPRARRSGRRGRASRRRGARLGDVLDACVDGDEEIARAGVPGIVVDSPTTPPGGSPSSRPSSSPATSSKGDRDHAPSASLVRLAASRIASRATSRSSNGCFTPAISWPCSWPLPAITTTSPGSASSTARRIAERRSGSTSTSTPAPWRMSWMIASGSSLRGLSEVTMTTSARSTRDLAHQRPLAAVAVAARAEDDDHASLPERRASWSDQRRATPACASSRRRP